MASHTPVTDRILGAVQRTHGCDLDTLTNSLSDLSWSQVFLEVDRLSRAGTGAGDFPHRRSLHDPAAGSQEGLRDPPRPALINEGV